MFGPPASAKEVFSPEEAVRHVKQRHGHLGGGISSASCDRRLNYNGDPGDPLGFKAERRANVAGENRSERPTSRSKESVCLCFNQGKMSRNEKGGRKCPVKFRRNYYAASEDNIYSSWFALRPWWTQLLQGVGVKPNMKDGVWSERRCRQHLKVCNTSSFASGRINAASFPNCLQSLVPRQRTRGDCSLHQRHQRRCW